VKRNIEPGNLVIMINRLHIISFSVVVILYLSAAVWKYSSSNNKDAAGDLTIVQSDEREQIMQFWEYYNLATAYRTDRKYELAAAHYENALNIQSDHEDALYYLGSMYLFQKEFDKTEKQWTQLELLQPNSPRTHLQLGTLYFCYDDANHLYNHELAIEKFETAWELNREETGAPLLISKILILKEHIEEAAELLNTVISSNHMSFEAVFLKGYIDWLNGQENRAMAGVRNSSNIYQNLYRSTLEGEGATEAGARAMLSEDMFCDSFEIKIRELLQEIHSMDYEEILRVFDNEVTGWR
jgi:tetratricopeptide (TPR) repeat protein